MRTLRHSYGHPPPSFLSAIRVYSAEHYHLWRAVDKMSNKKSRAELAAENKILRRSQGVGSLAIVANNLIKWGGLVAISYFIYLSIDSLAGETTAADIGIGLLADIKLSDAAAWVFGGSGTVYGLRQRTLRRSTIERLQARIKELEKAIDPKRTSSGLTTRGETHPMDEV